MNSGSATGRGRRGASSLVVVLCAAALLSSSPAASFTVHLHSTLPSACSRTQIAASSSFLRSLVVPECKGTGASFLSHACWRTGMGGLVPRAGGEPDSKRSPAEFNRDPGESEIKTFLTQRALQNLVFILATLGRDEITADWLEAWQGHEGIRHYHGTSGLHIGGRAFITKLMRTPNEEVVVEFKRRGNGMTGGSPERAAALGQGGNPFLKDHVFQHKTKIEPRRLADRLLRIRKEVADEWLEDLKLLGKENDEMWRSFFETVRENEDKLKNLQMPVFPHDPSDGPTGTSFRGGNYDLLRRLATFKAIQKLLDEYSSGNAGDVAKAGFLQRMLTVHGSGFEGEAPYCVDKTFFKALLDSPPSMIRSTSAGGHESMVLVSPLSIVEDICRVRQTIAELWSKELEQVPDDHVAIQRELLQGSL